MGLIKFIKQLTCQHEWDKSDKEVSDEMYRIVKNMPPESKGKIDAVITCNKCKLTHTINHYWENKIHTLH